MPDWDQQTECEWICKKLYYSIKDKKLIIQWILQGNATVWMPEMRFKITLYG